VVDAVARDDSAGRWSCDEDASRRLTLPLDASLGATAGGEGGAAALLFSFAAGGSVRRHRATCLGGACAAVEGPPVSGDAPPWVPIGPSDAPRFAYLEPGSAPRLVVAERAKVLAAWPIAIGDELAVDAVASASSIVVAATVAQGVEVHAGVGSSAHTVHVVPEAYGPAVLVSSSGAISVAARVDAALEAPSTSREVSVAHSEGAGQESVGSSLVVVTVAGKAMATYPLPAGAEVLGPTADRGALLTASARVIRGARVVAVDAIRADGKRTRVGEFSVPRAARLVPVAAPTQDALGSVLAIDDGVPTLLGMYGGPLPLRDVEAVLAARLGAEQLDMWLVRDESGSKTVTGARCAWARP
jgi:hypothetical protein